LRIARFARHKKPRAGPALTRSRSPASLFGGYGAQMGDDCVEIVWGERRIVMVAHRRLEQPQLLRWDPRELGGVAHILVIGANEFGETFRGHLLGRSHFRAEADQAFRGGASGTQALGDRLL